MYKELLVLYYTLHEAKEEAEKCSLKILDKKEMNISKLLKDADDAYINYRHRCEALAKEAQKYIEWDDRVSCEHFPADGLCILATIPDDCNIGGMPECVCPAEVFIFLL